MKIFTATIILLSVLALLLTGCGVYGHISGVVRDAETGEGLGGVLISVGDFKQTWSASNGSWTIRNLRDGYWSVQAKKSGYITCTDTVEVENHKTTTYNISMASEEANQPPVLDPIGNMSTQQGEDLFFTVTASDPDGDTLTFSALNLPAGAALDSSTGEFQWLLTENYTEIGDYDVTLKVSDGSLEDSEVITITVEM